MMTSTKSSSLPRRSPRTSRPAGGRQVKRNRRSSPPPTSPPTRRSRRLSKPQKQARRSSPNSTEDPPSQRRRSGRGSSSLWDLARFIQEGKRVVFITGAGLSVASGVPVFRTTNNSSHLYSNDMAWKSIINKGPHKQTTKSKNVRIEEQPLGIWNSVLWTQATRKAYRKDPLEWYNDFWLSYFPVDDYENKYSPNEGHLTLAALQQAFPETIKIITQNVDGLHNFAVDEKEANNRNITGKLKQNIIEAHGRLGLYKCLPEEDSDTDSSSDEDDDRPVHLGHRRKYRAWKRKHHAEVESQIKGAPMGAVSTDVSSGSSTNSSVRGPTCRYQMLESLRVDQLSPPEVRDVLVPTKNCSRRKRKKTENCGEEKEQEGKPRLLAKAPRCPSCGNPVLPQALLFDEGYHSHEHYNFLKMEDWLAAAEVIVFVGTSFAVTLPLVALDHAKEVGLPVFNFNISDMLESNARLNAENIAGPSQETLPKLFRAIQHLEQGGSPWEY
jgi:NAD-dependent SIR2 family protein deacetylase